MRRTITTLFATLALLATGVVAGLAAGGTGTVDPLPRIAFLANGIVPADALAAGGIAGQLGAPLFTTPADTLNNDASAGIAAYDPDLVIVLGGPVAISDAVVNEVAATLGLPVVAPDPAPDDGVVRVAGGDRFATARAVAALLAAYDPAYLPVDATALGAVDADTASEAENADTLDGLHADAFARSDQACDPGDLVTAVDADGVLLCTPDDIDGGDAATVDGLDASDLLTSKSAVTAHGGSGWLEISPGAPTTTARRVSGVSFSGDGSATLPIDAPTVFGGRSWTLDTIDVCHQHTGGGTITQVTMFRTNSDATATQILDDGTDLTANGCTTYDVGASLDQGGGIRVFMGNGGTVRLEGVRATWSPGPLLRSDAATYGGGTSTDN